MKLLKLKMKNVAIVPVFYCSIDLLFIFFFLLFYCSIVLFHFQFLKTEQVNSCGAAEPLRKWLRTDR